MARLRLVKWEWVEMPRYWVQYWGSTAEVVDIGALYLQNTNEVLQSDITVWYLSSIATCFGPTNQNQALRYKNLKT